MSAKRGLPERQMRKARIQQLNEADQWQELKQGDKGTYGGFRAVVVRHYSGNMYEIKLPGGVACVDAYYFQKEQGN